MESNNNPPPPVSKSIDGTKNTYITVVLEKDKEFANKTQFTKGYINIEMEFNQYDILNLLSESDKEKIMKQLHKK